MNRDKIKEKYPKAYKKCLYGVWGEPNDVGFLDCKRLLYDFFDEQGVYIEMTYGGEMWRYDIVDTEAEYLGHSKEIYSTRIEAEEKAFEKAFEILEDKL